MKMKLFGLALFAVCSLAVVPAAMADVTCPVAPGAALSTFIAPPTPTNAPCDIGNLKFDAFSYSFAPVPGGVTAADITVFQTSHAGPPLNVGLEFVAGWDVGGVNPANLDSNIGFTVSTLDGSTFHDIQIDFGAASTTGTGSITYSENYCITGTGTCGSFQITGPPSNFTSEIILTGAFANATSLTITKDLSLHSGTSGTAHVSAFDNAYSLNTVPEPRSISIVAGLILLAAVAFLKRRQAVRS